MFNKFNQDQYQKEDRRNLIVFMLVVFGLFAIYDIFIKQPYVDKIRTQQQEEIANNPSIENTVENTKSKTPIATPRIKIESDVLKGSIALRGARIDDITLLNFYETISKKDEVTLLSPSGSEQAYYGQFGWLASGSDVQVPGRNTVWSVRGNKILTPDTPVILYWNNGQGFEFSQKISLDKNYMFTVEQKVRNTTNASKSLYPYGLIAQHGTPPDLQKAYILHEGPIGYYNSKLTEIKYKKFEKEPRVEALSLNGWIGFTEKYWFVGLVPEQGQQTKYRFLAQPSGDTTLYQTDILGGQTAVNGNEEANYTTRFYAGPKKVRVLDAYEETFNIPHFDLVVDFGMFYFLTKPFFYVLTWLSNTLGSFAWGLIVFTVILRLLMFPLANKSFRSFAKMRTIAPKMKEMQERHKGDKNAMQKALFDLYKKEDVNPAAGCLPIVLQIPIFFALYKVLFVSLEMRHTPFFGWINDMSAPDPTSLFNLFGLIPWDPPSFLMIGAWPCIMLITLLIQQRLSPPPTEAFQKQLMMMMPFVMTFVLSGFPAGLVIYWTWSNILSVIQQAVLMKSMGVDIHLFSFLGKKTEKEKVLEQAPKTTEQIEHEVEKAIDKPKKPISAPKRRRKKK